MGGTVLVVRREDQAIVGRHRDKAHALVQVSALEKVSFATRSEAGRYAANMRWKGHVKGLSTRKGFAYNKVEGYLGNPLSKDQHRDGVDIFEETELHLRDSRNFEDSSKAGIGLAGFTKQMVESNLAFVLTANMTPEELVAAGDALLEMKYGPKFARARTWGADFEANALAMTVVKAWASSSNDSNTVSLAVQRIVAREFGLTDTTELSQIGETDTDALERYVTNLLASPQVDKALTLAVHAQYDATQAFLKAQGIKSVELHRGMKSVTLWNDVSSDYGQPHVEQQRELQSRPLSSWSVQGGVARLFFSDDYDGVGRNVMLRRIVPASQIFSTPFTGVGCLKETEMVILGGTDNTFAKAHNPL